VDQSNEKPQVYGWPHDENGHPMRLISKTWRVSCKTNQNNRDSPWIAHEETITEPVPMGARDEIAEDRKELSDDVLQVVLAELNEQLDAVHDRIKNSS
jgi:hypothetical protein